MTLVCSPQPFIPNPYPYQDHQYSTSPTPSFSSSTSSASSGVWSVSSASSVATSVSSSSFDCPTAVLPCHPSFGAEQRALPRRNPAVQKARQQHPAPLSIAAPVDPPLPAEQRQNPRRTTRLVDASTSTCTTAGGDGAPPPPVPTLQRQADRKVNFVENLVDSAAQIVETIWPAPKPSPQAAAAADKVLPLRTFIQETLRRSRTSYSTLQVALYYLIVIRPHLPKCQVNISEMEPSEAQLVRAMQCGRRMFLAALILASKYLQDRNYSARAWSKISGLNTQEININEMAFLRAIDWKLHITEDVFQKWTDLVLKYTQPPSPSPVSPTRVSGAPWYDDEDKRRQWCELVLKLSPDLSEVPSCPSSASESRPSPGDVDCDSLSLTSNSPVVAACAPVKILTPPPPKTTTPPPPKAARAPLRKSKSTVLRVPNPPAPPRTLEPQVQDRNAFKSLHQPSMSSFPPQFRRSATAAPCLSSLSSSSSASHQAPAAGAMVAAAVDKRERRPSIGLGRSAMACAQQVAQSSMFDHCAREPWNPGRRLSETGSAYGSSSSSRRSSLSTCLLQNSHDGSSSSSSNTNTNTNTNVAPLPPPIAAAPSIFSPGPRPATPTPSSARHPYPLKRQTTDDLKRKLVLLPTPTPTPPPVLAPCASPSYPTSNRPPHASRPMPVPYVRQPTPSLSSMSSSSSTSTSSTLTSTSTPSPVAAACAFSPKIHEAALGLNMLRDATTASPPCSASSAAGSGSACSTPLVAGRKRSWGGGLDGGAVIPRTDVTPKLSAVRLSGGCASPSERKRVRCGIEGGWSRMAAQNVR